MKVLLSRCVFVSALVAAAGLNSSELEERGICDSIHGLQCFGEDLKNAGTVSSHEDCCQACQALSGCRAWTWNWQYGGDCYLKAGCSDRRSGSAYHSGVAAPGPSPGPSPPSPSPSPSPGHSDLQLSWPEGGGHGACSGKAVQGSSVIQTNGNDITITTDAAPSGSCVFRNAQPSINLEEYSQIEVDLQASGNHAAYGQHSGMWFSFWMYPPQYAYKHGIAESGEVDFVENINSVRTNFAGCRHDCHETSWGQSANQVSAHITAFYDKSSETVNVYRCAHGSKTCGTGGERAFIDLKKMQVNKPYMYTFSADVWYAKPGFNFKFVVSNLRILRNSEWSTVYSHSNSSVIV